MRVGFGADVQAMHSKVKAEGKAGLVEKVKAQLQPQKQRVFTGVVTKLHDDFDFVELNVFFQLSAVKGKTQKMGNRVLVEATYNASMPFK